MTSFMYYCGLFVFYVKLPWFNVILFRGLKTLYEEDDNKSYVSLIQGNLQYVWKNARDENGLFEKKRE